MVRRTIAGGRSRRRSVGAAGEHHARDTLPLPGGASLEDVERSYIARVLGTTDTLEAAAETLGIAPSTLWRKRRKYNL